MVNIRMPAHPVQKRGLWPPANGRPYPVQDDDTWGKIADRERLDVWGLIHFNFQTYVPEEVNWYLRELVGCKLSTDQGRNYAFRGADKAKATVYIPPIPNVLPQTVVPWWEKHAKLKYEVEHSNDPSRERYLCILSVMEARHDDRVIFWDLIAPGPDTPVPIGVRKGLRSLADAQWLFDNFKTWQDVAALPLGDGTNPRQFVLSLHKVLFEAGNGSFDALRAANAKIAETHFMLDRMANQPVAGSKSMPREYRAIADFVGLGERSVGSVMNCITTTGS
ncbi:MAG: hypothetical protein KGM15_06780 [Pseudomonadota bacterium]|nr:hypothetical protein [Pseudomonadota bacterium]